MKTGAARTVIYAMVNLDSDHNKLCYVYSMSVSLMQNELLYFWVKDFLVWVAHTNESLSYIFYYFFFLNHLFYVTFIKKSAIGTSKVCMYQAKKQISSSDTTTITTTL